MQRVLLLLVIIPIIFSCKKTEHWNTEGETMYLKTDDAVLPIWITGNVASGIFIICNHGGPGFGSAFDFHTATSFRNLEKEYAVVYYDQRFAGNSKGDPITGSITLQHHITDLDRVITLIEHHYSPGSIFIYGHSWGGGLTISYLGWEGMNKTINGWINSNGSLQDRWEMELKREWQIPRAQAKYNETGDQKWLDIIDWWTKNPYPDEGDNEPYQFVDMLDGWIYDEDEANALNPYSKGEKHFFSFFQIMPWTDVYNYTNFVAGYNFMPAAPKILQPSLLIWGKEDGSVPFQVADSLYTLIQTPEADKYKYVLEECGHTPHWEKPNKFYSLVVEFIEKYK